MSRIEMVDLTSLTDGEEIEAYYREKMGFVTNSARLLAHCPPILRASMELGRATQSPDSLVNMKLKKMMALVASSVRGCILCQAHAGHGLSRQKVPDDKVARIWDFETDPVFDERERAALRLVRDSACQPNAVTDELFVELNVTSPASRSWNSWRSALFPPG
jgi:alkylhydroperoxidase family enzyme